MDISLYTGDSRNLVINVVDENNNPINLTGSIVKWILTNQDNIELTKSVGAGITIPNPTQGQFTIALTTNDTKRLNGNYQHIARVTTSDGNSSIVLSGNITVQSSLI